MKYSAPIDGKKHYVVTLSRWARTTERVVLASDAADARYQVLPRRGVTEYIVSARRARPEEVESGSETE